MIYEPDYHGPVSTCITRTNSTRFISPKRGKTSARDTNDTGRNGPLRL